MTLRDQRNGRFISAQGYRTLFQPRDSSGRFARSGTPLIQPVQKRPQPSERVSVPFLGTEEEAIEEATQPEEEPEEEEREWVVEVEVRGSYSG